MDVCTCDQFGLMQANLAKSNEMKAKRQSFSVLFDVGLICVNIFLINTILFEKNVG